MSSSHHRIISSPHHLNISSCHHLFQHRSVFTQNIELTHHNQTILVSARWLSQGAGDVIIQNRRCNPTPFGVRRYLPVSVRLRDPRPKIKVLPNGSWIHSVSRLVMQYLTGNGEAPQCAFEPTHPSLHPPTITHPARSPPTSSPTTHPASLELLNQVIKPLWGASVQTMQSRPPLLGQGNVVLQMFPAHP